MAQRKGAAKPLGSGKQKGYKAPSTLAKEAARELLRIKLTQEIDALVSGLVSRAKGVRYFVTRTDKGKYEIVTDPNQVIKALNREDGYIGEFYTDKPDVPAIKEAFDRMVDKSKEQIQEIALSGDAHISALLAGRERAAKRKKSG